MIKRVRIKHSLSFQDRLTAFSKKARIEAEELPPGLEREDKLRKARQADTAANLESWVNSTGLQPPK